MHGILIDHLSCISMLIDHTRDFGFIVRSVAGEGLESRIKRRSGRGKHYQASKFP